MQAVAHPQSNPIGTVGSSQGNKTAGIWNSTLIWVQNGGPSHPHLSGPSRSLVFANEDSFYAHEINTTPCPITASPTQCRTFFNQNFAHNQATVTITWWLKAQCYTSHGRQTTLMHKAIKMSLRISFLRPDSSCKDRNCTTLSYASYNLTCNVRINITLRRISVTAVAVKRQ